MITQDYFKKYCNKIFNDECEFKSAMVNDTEFRIHCYFNKRLVAKMDIDERMKSVVDVYTADLCSTSTRFKWRFRHLLKEYTYVDRHKSYIIKEINKLVNSKFYAHSDDIWELIDKVTDDVFAIDVGSIAAKLMDKADMLRFGEIKWRTHNNQRDKEG